MLALPDGVVITGSQDKMVHIWSNGKKVQSFQGHDDIIRQIIPIKDLGFATCSNDESIKLWDLSGKLLQTMKGHNAYVYTIATSVYEEIVSGSEDNTVKVWKDGAFIDSIAHPGSVWSIVTNSFGDIVTACEDKEVRVFTRDTTRFAPELAREEYSKQCIGKSARYLAEFLSLVS